MNIDDYRRIHLGCGGEMIKNSLAKHFLEEWLCLKCNKTTWDLGCKIELNKVNIDDSNKTRIYEVI